MEINPTEIDAPLTLEETQVDAPLTVEETVIRVPVTIQESTVAAPVTVQPIVISAPLTIGGAGGPSVLDYYEAAEALSGHRAVTFNEDGLVIYADASLGIPAVAMIRDSVSAGGLVKLYHGGWVNGFSGLQIGATYWLKNAGQISATPPESGILQRIGTPVADNIFLVEVSEPTSIN